MGKEELSNKRKATLAAQMADRLRKKAPGSEMDILTIVIRLLFGENARLMITKGEDAGKSV